MTDDHRQIIADDLEWGMRLQKAGVLDEAAAAYGRVLELDECHPEAVFLLAAIDLSEGRPGDAAAGFALAVAVSPEAEEAQAGLMSALETLAPDARPAVLDAIAADPRIAGARDGLGAVLRVLRLTGESEAAHTLAERALGQTGETAELLRLKASALVDLGRLHDAVAAFTRAVELMPSNGETRTAYSAVLARLGRTEEAFEQAAASAALAPAEPAPDIRRAGLMQWISCALELGMGTTVAEQLREMAAAAPEVPEVWAALARCLYQTGAHEAAAAAAGTGLGHAPGHLELEWLHCVYALAPLYRSMAEIGARRARYRRRLADLAARLSNADAHTRDRARLLAADLSPYLLPYQYGEDDRALQEIYGGMLCDLAPPVAPSVAPAEGPRDPDDGRLHVVFVSGFIWRHTNWRMKRGWVKFLDRSRFHVSCLHLGERQDEMTDEIRGYADAFHHLPSDVEGAASLLRNLLPDIVFYPEIGMSGAAQRLAAMRLAPVQCCAIGHPVTTGMRSIDYFVSGELVEGDGADADYSERLVRLPGISFPYLPAPLPAAALSRAHFGLADNATLYLCLQTPQKYLPADDGLYPEIARRVPNAVFIFLQGGSAMFDKRILESRLTDAFRTAGLDPAAHLRFLPHLSPTEYQALNAIGDVALDTPGWSGGNTTLEALYQDLPVVTMPGRLMRASVSAGMLKLIGVEDTIATDPDDYVAIAARLGAEPDWRAAIASKIRAQRARLENDMRSITAMENFFEEAVVKAGREAP